MGCHDTWVYSNEYHMGDVDMRIVVLRDKKMGNFWGMNHEAGKELGVKHCPKEGTIYLSDKLSKKRQKKVILHENVESWLMKNKKYKYAKAHKVANQFEWHSFEKVKR